MAARTFDPQPIYMNVLPTPMEWAIDGRIPEDGVTCFLGKPGSGKTFATIDAACCMATGLDCWGPRVGPPQKVIYIAAESGPGVRLRIMAWIISHLDALKAAEIELVVDDQGRQSLPNLLLWPKAVNLRPKRPGEAAAAVTEAINEIKASGLSADVLCIDTASWCTTPRRTAKNTSALLRSWRLSQP
jgi:KaiC/GvpD/RAD55 family RecA-like ATPase